MSMVSEKIEEEILVRLLHEQQPSSKESLESLRKHFAGKGGRGAFAEIRSGSCGACYLSIAHVRLQSAKNGTFISCTNCGRFLYWPAAVPVTKLAEQPGQV